MPSIERPDIMPDTLGAQAVFNEEDRVDALIYIGQVEANMEYAGRLLLNNNGVTETAPACGTTEKYSGEPLSANEVTFITETMQRSEAIEPIKEFIIDSADTGVMDELEKVSSSLLDIDKIGERTLEDYMEMHAPQFLKDVKASFFKEEPTTWKDWMIRAPREQVLNILQWHNARIASLQSSPEIKATIATQKAAYAAAVKQLVEQGDLDLSCLDKLQVLDTVDVYVGDIFSTVMKGISGYHRPGTTYVVGAQGSGEQDEEAVRLTSLELEDVLFHEFNHALLGSFASRWLDEAITEHIALAMKYGYIGVLDPANRAVDSYVYSEERDLLALILQLGSDHVPLSRVLRAYSGTLTDYYLMKTSIDRSLGCDDSLSAISRRIEELEETAIRKGQNKREAQCSALRTVRSDLLQQPQVIFGKDYVPAGKHVLVRSSTKRNYS